MPHTHKAVNLDNMAHLFAPIIKVDKAPTLADDGLPEYVIVKGICSGPGVDLDQQRMDPEWLRKELPTWYQEWGNIREMHQAKAVGVATGLEEQDDGDWHLTAKVVDRDAVRKVIEGVYKGFSIGIKSPVLAPDAKAPKGRYVGGTVIETSLVDRPAYSAAKFDGVEQPVLAAKFVLGQAVGPGEWRESQTGVVLRTAAAEAASHMPNSGALVPQAAKGGSTVAELSFEQIRDLVNRALRPADPDKGPWVYVMDTYPTYVIINEGEKYFQVPYMVNTDGAVTLGDKVEVVRTYTAVAKAAAIALAKKAAEGEDEDDEKAGEGDEKPEDEDANKAADADGCSHCGRELADGKCSGCEKDAGECTCEQLEGKSAKAAGAAPVTGTMDFSGIGHDVLKAIKPALDAMAAQVDSALKQINEAVANAKASLPTTGHAGAFDPNNPSVKAALTEIVKAVLVGEFASRATDPEFSGKVVGTDSAKAVLADVVKGLVDQAVGGIEQRLQTVEQAAAPARGQLMEVERAFAGIQAAGASPQVVKAAQTLVQFQNDNSELAQLQRAQAMMVLSQATAKQ